LVYHPFMHYDLIHHLDVGNMELIKIDNETIKKNNISLGNNFNIPNTNQKKK